MKKNLLLLFAFVLISCDSKNDNYITIDGFAEGTTYHIIYNDPQKRDLSENFAKFFEDFENSLSIYNPSSIVSRMNDNDTTAYADDWFVECLAISKDIYRRSHGLLDITLRPLISAYGFGGESGPRALSSKQVDSMLKFVGCDKVELRNRQLIKKDNRTELDFNAVAKGYSVDLLGKMLDSLGMSDYLVEVGGEIVTKGKNEKNKEWTIAIDTPLEGNYTPGADVQAVLALSGKGMATSGNYRRFATDEYGNKVVHTIDPRTGKSSMNNLLSVTIVAPSCAVADGFATACMVAGLDEARKIIAENPELDALFIYSEDDKMLTETTENMKKWVLQSK